jgi:hypothetical protein
VATSALIAYHFRHQRAVMSAFLDALAIPHEEGQITAEDMDPPASDRLPGAVATVRASFPPDDVELYLRTLVALDGGTWKHLAGLLRA